MFLLPIVIEPLCISQNLAINFAIVLFPLPDGPTNAVMLPCGIVHETFE